MSNATMNKRDSRTSRDCSVSTRFGQLIREDAGQGILEFALVLPIMLTILLGMVEFANTYDRVHGMAGISREGANIASRGTALSEVLSVVLADGQTINMQTRGGAVVSRVVIREGSPTVEAQVASDGFTSASRLLSGGRATEEIAQAGYAEGSTLYVVETFLTYEPITPLSRLLKSAGPDELYQRAVF